MEKLVEDLNQVKQEFQSIIETIAWSEKWKVIELKQKAELLAMFIIDEPVKAREVKVQIEETIVDFKNVIQECKREAA
jgi:seryl-tRNA synthetase